MNKKKLMILGASILQIPAIKKAKEMGLEVIAVDYDENAPGFKFADIKLVISTIDVKGVVQAAEKYNPDGIITIASDMPMETVATVGEKLGLNTISLKTALNTTNKFRMRNTLKSENVPIPTYFAVKTLEEAKSNFKYFSDRFIVKPADNSGSRGVSLVYNLAELEIAFFHAQQFSRSNEVLMEEYMVGPEVSVESITINNETNIIAITDKITTGSPHFVELGHSIPSNLELSIKKEIESITKAANKALGITTGPSHTEIIITKEGPKIVEVGARLGGDNITSHLVPLATGVDMVELCIKNALNESINVISSAEKGAAIKYLDLPMGQLISLSEDALKNKEYGVIDIQFSKHIGDIIPEVKSSNDRVGFVITVDETSQQALLKCDKVIENLNIKVKEI